MRNRRATAVHVHGPLLPFASPKSCSKSEMLTESAKARATEDSPGQDLSQDTGRLGLSEVAALLAQRVAGRSILVSFLRIELRACRLQIPDSFAEPRFLDFVRASVCSRAASSSSACCSAWRVNSLMPAATRSRQSAARRERFFSTSHRALRSSTRSIGRRNSVSGISQPIVVNATSKA